MAPFNSNKFAISIELPAALTKCKLEFLSKQKKKITIIFAKKK